MKLSEYNKLTNDERAKTYKEFWEPKLSELSDLYNNQMLNQSQIAEIFNVHPSQISKLFVRYGIAKRNPVSKYKILQERGFVENTCELCGAKFNTYWSQKRKYCSEKCYQAVHTDNKKIVKICQHCGKSFDVYVSDIVRDNRGAFCSNECRFLEMKTSNVTAVCLNCGTEIYTNISRITDGRGKFCSRGCAGVWLAKNGEFDYRMKRSSKSGRRTDLNDRYFRSSWEANYARYLNWLIQQGEIELWEYEVDTFKFPVKKGNMSYLPDFKITNPNGTIEYHEVKGYMDDDSRVKLNRMAKYFPDVKVVLIDKEYYAALAKQIKPLIEGWE